MTADVEADRPDQKAEQVGRSPAPTVELALRERSGEHDPERGGEHCRQALACPLEASEEALAVRPMLDEERGRAAELAADRKALHQPGDQDTGRSQQADCSVCRQDRHQQGADHHQLDRHQERCLSSGAIRVCAEHKGSERPNQIGGPERSEREQQGNRFVVGREEQAGDGDCKISIDQQIEPFECIADRRGADGLPCPLRRPLAS